MRDVVIFNGLNALDFHEIRDSVIRIPEVSIRVREAQGVWDALGESNFSFFNFLVSEDATYLSNIKIKSLVTSIVQIGLYDRYVRRFGRPEYIVGSVNGDSPLQVCIGETTFEDMILDSPVAKPVASVTEIFSQSSSTVLSGISLAETGVFQHLENTGKYQRVSSTKQDLGKIISHLIEDCHVKKLINVGPGITALEPLQENLALKDIQIVESIDADPMLNWFWMELKKSSEQVSMAQ
ncbi:MAG: hypothetical protein H6625_11155 [Bdellovibrionaceae bacterium]|nr:hypothetical protein [Pseudobdellovibrionaceae bacterium]